MLGNDKRPPKNAAIYQIFVTSTEGQSQLLKLPTRFEPQSGNLVGARLALPTGGPGTSPLKTDKARVLNCTVE
jgi:hypothetical protein